MDRGVVYGVCDDDDDDDKEEQREREGPFFLCPTCCVCECVCVFERSLNSLMLDWTAEGGKYVAPPPAKYEKCYWVGPPREANMVPSSREVY